jgi:hypothetical protein
VLPTLDEEEKALLREHFSRDSLDILKTPRAIMREIGCRGGLAATLTN